MDLLEGSIAFVLALAGFATICTVLVEILHRIAGLRSSGLKQMLEIYFENAIEPRLANKDVEKLRKDFMDRLMNNPLVDKFTTDTPLGLVRKQLLISSEVSTEDLLRRLWDTELFQDLKQAGKAQAQALTQELTDSYDQFGAAATDYFKRRARLISILVGILLALSVNIHAVRLFDTFVKNPELAQQMQAQAENIRKELEQQTAPLPADNTQVEDSVAQIEEDLQKAVESLNSYQKMGLPIGWSYYPNCLPETKDPQCKPIIEELSKKEKPGKGIGETLKQDAGAAASWLFGILLTGILIGLGGPFWFDVAVRLSQVRQALTGKAAIQPMAAAPAESDRDKAVAATAKRLTAK